MLRSTLARILIAALAAAAVGSAVAEALPDEGISSLPAVFTQAGEGLGGS
jgi:hypothetical protein